MKEICPYYFDLEEKFLERAVIKPSVTVDELFDANDDDAFGNDTHFDNSAEGKNSNSSVYSEDENQKQPSDSAKRSSDAPRSAAKSKQISSKKEDKQRSIRDWWV